MFQPTGLTATATPEEFVTDLLHDVIDPELGLNIVDLGLLRRVAVDADAGVEHFGCHASFTATCLMRVYSSIE